MKIIRMRDYGPRVRAGVHAQQFHDQIARALKTSSRVRLDFTDVESVGQTFSIEALASSSRGTVRRSFGRLCSCTAVRLSRRASARRSANQE